MYPAVSLTFILREVEALRGLGAEVVTCSVRRTSPKQHPGPLEKAHAAVTFNILAASARPATALAALGWALRRPGRLVATLRLAWASRGPGVRATALQAAYTAEAVVLARHLATERVEHVHNHFVSASATVAMLAAQLVGIPFSYTLHGPTDFFEPLRWKIGTKTAHAAFVACISHYCRAQAMVFSDPTHWSKLHIVRCGVTPTLYARPRPDRPAEPVELLFVGRLARVKGLLVLFEALAQITKGPTLRLTVAGDGPERTFLEEAARPLGDRVRFTGYLSQDAVADRLATADIFVLPSFAEGVPVVLMEAMAAGVPVIATRVAGVSELVEEGVSGLLVPAGDSESLARALADLAAEPARRSAMGRAGRAKVNAEFDIESAATRLLGLIVQARYGGAGRENAAP